MRTQLAWNKSLLSVVKSVDASTNFVLYMINDIMKNTVVIVIASSSPKVVDSITQTVAISITFNALSLLVAVNMAVVNDFNGYVTTGPFSTPAQHKDGLPGMGFHLEDKKFMRLSYINYGNYYTGKTATLF